jgi:hypothetical protein
VLWSNLLKMDRRNARPSADAVDDLLRLRLLEREIEITRPDVVVFFTGDVKRAFRTYHPNFLRLRRQWHRVTEIGEAIAGMAQSASR